MFKPLKDTLRQGWPRDKFFKLGLLLSALQSLSAVALLGVSSWLISRAAEVNSIVYLGLAIVGVRGFAVGKATFRYAERLLLHDSAFRMLAARRPQLFVKIAPFIPAGMATTGRGEVISRIVTDVDELQNLPLRVIAPLVQAVAVSVSATVFMFLLLPGAGFALLATILIAFFVAIPFSAFQSKRGDISIAPMKAELADMALDILENQEIYLAYGWIESKRSKLSELDSRLRAATAKVAISNGMGLSLISLMTTVAMISGAWISAKQVVAHALPGSLLAVFTLLPISIFEVIQNAQPIISAFRKYRVSAVRVEELLQKPTPKELKLQSGGLRLDEFESLALKSVEIRYPEALTKSVSDLDLSLKAGDILLISGDSGSGKTSIAYVLARLMDISAGSYLINGIPANRYSIQSIRSAIGLVEQTPMVFVGDVRANLLIARPSAGDQDLISVLKEVGLWSVFANREGLDTQLGDRGVRISGGEAQRLALARAILAKFQVLILDEPTANLDQLSADALIYDLTELARRREFRSIVLISHEERYKSLASHEIRLQRLSN